MEAKQLKSEVDPSEGTSKHRRVKLKPASRTQSHGQLGVVSESHLVKCSRNNQKKKKKKEKKKNVSRLQTVADASEADMAGGSDSHLVKRKRVKRKKFKKQLRDLSGTDGGCNGKQTRATSLSIIEILEGIRLKLARTALEFYEKSQGGEFEILLVLAVGDSCLRHPEIKNSMSWVHTSFTAKPKNSDLSPKHVFGELYKDDLSGKYHATYCSTFEPSNDPGFDHGCIFCPPGQKFHPADGYLAGRPPWCIRKFIYV